MKQKNNNFLRICITVLLLVVSSSFSQCFVKELAKDLSRNPSLKDLLSSNKKNFDAWVLLVKENPSMRSSIIEIRFVADNIDDINKLGGYTKWKNHLDELTKKMPSNFFENANFKNADDLATTFDPLGKLSKHHRGLIFNYYKQAIEGNKPHLWKKIEDIFNEYKLNDGWPPANGGYNIKNNIKIIKGQKFDRYQQWFKLENGKPAFGGSFTSPLEKNSAYSYTQRALKGAKTDYAILYEIEILKDLPIEGQLSQVIPWFGQKGGGKQMLFNFNKSAKYKSFQDLIDGGYIRVTIKESPNGKYKHWIGKSFGSLANAGSTGIKVVDDFLAIAPKINNISTSSIPSGYQIVVKNNSKYIRRIDATNVNTPRLMVDETGTIVKYTKPQRLAKNGKLRDNLEKALGKIPENHQAHHIVPDNVVKNSPIHQEAIKRGLYDVDRPSNGKFLAETDEDLLLPNASVDYPTHFGSHPNYDAEIVKIITPYREALLTKYGSLEKIPTEDLNKVLDLIESKSLEVLTNWKPSKLN